MGGKENGRRSGIQVREIWSVIESWNDRSDDVGSSHARSHPDPPFRDRLLSAATPLPDSDSCSDCPVRRAAVSSLGLVLPLPWSSPSPPLAFFFGRAPPASGCVSPCLRCPAPPSHRSVETLHSVGGLFSDNPPRARPLAYPQTLGSPRVSFLPLADPPLFCFRPDASH
jgi:hypothetical protein